MRALLLADLLHRHELIRGHAVCLSFQLQRLDRLHLDRVPDESVGRVAEENLEGGCRLLESRSGVDGVPRDETLTRARIAGDDLAGVHAGPVAQRHPPA